MSLPINNQQSEFTNQQSAIRMGSMNHGEKIAPVAAATTALATLVCCLPVGFAAAAATASLSAVVSAYRGWFLLASAGLLALGIAQLARAQRKCATRKRGSVAILAASATIVVLVALFPQVIAAFIAAWLP
jgi:hypothetical protein